MKQNKILFSRLLLFSLICLNALSIPNSFAFIPLMGGTNIIEDSVKGFCTFDNGTDTVICSNKNPVLHLSHGKAMTINMFPANDTIFFNATGVTGPQGPQGPKGDTGSTGTAGSQIYTGSGSPSGGLGVDGDFYLNVVNGNYYQKSGGSWVLSGNLIGPQGPEGPGIYDTLQNIGGGTGIYAGNNTLTNFQLNTLSASGSSSLSLNSNVIDIYTHTYQNNTGSNLGTYGENVYVSMSGDILQFKKLVSNNSQCSYSSNSTNVILTCTPSSGIASINGDTTSAQLIQGISGNTTVSTSTGTTTVNLGSNVVTTGGSAQTITKGLTINSGTLGGDLNASSHKITNLSTPTLSSDAQVSNHLGLIGSLITGVCGNGQYLKYQTSNSTWICSTVSSGIATINLDPATNQFLTGAVGNITITDNGVGGHSFKLGQNVVVNNKPNNYTAGKKQSFQADGTNAGLNFGGVSSDPSSVVSGDVWRNTVDDALKIKGSSITQTIPTLEKTETFTGTTTLNSLKLGGNANASSNRITNVGTPTVDTDAARANTLQKKALATGTCADGQYLSYQNSNSTWICASPSGPSVLDADVSTTSSTSYSIIFTIPLTPSKTNVIEAILAQESNTAGVAIQNRGRVDDASDTGTCSFYTVDAATASPIDNIAVSTNPADTGEATLLAVNQVMPNRVFCTVTAGGSASNLILEFESETGSSATVTTRAGSFYSISHG